MLILWYIFIIELVIGIIIFNHQPWIKWWYFVKRSIYRKSSYWLNMPIMWQNQLISFIDWSYFSICLSLKFKNTQLFICFYRKNIISNERSFTFKIFIFVIPSLFVNLFNPLRSQKLRNMIYSVLMQPLIIPTTKVVEFQIEYKIYIWILSLWQH